MTRRHWFSALAAGALLLGGGSPALGQGEKPPPRELPSFGVLRAVGPEEARSQAQDWLKGVGKTDDATRQAFDAAWNDDRPLLDKVAATLALGDPEAKRLLDEARNADAAAPTALPALLKDAKKPAFYRANLALAYAKVLGTRRVHEEALEALKTTRPEQVVDPASFLFTRAVAEHGLMLKKEATETIARLLDDVADAPERYKTVSALMYFDMQSWQDKDLGWISRKMDNVERRLDLSRGGPQTQKQMKEILARLDEIIKELENQDKGA